LKIITIGGLPGAGKTYTSKLLAKELNCLAIEVESLRWDFFSENPQLNMFNFTYNEPINQNESLRDYYLRCALYERKINLKRLVQWHNKIVDFIDGKLSEIVTQIKSIKTQQDYDDFFLNYKNIINYKPEFSGLNLNIIIISHAFINVMEFSKRAYLNIDFNSDYPVLIKRFIEREKIQKNYDNELKDYYDSYSSVLKKSNAIKFDTSKINVVGKIKNLL